MLDSTIFLASKIVMFLLNLISIKFPLSFVYDTKSWKHGMVFLAVWAFGIVGTIFLCGVWVPLITLSTWQMFSVALPMVPILMRFKTWGCGDILFYLLRKYPILTFLEIIDLLKSQIECMYLYLFTTSSNGYPFVVCDPSQSCFDFLWCS